jgi:NDP-4-keto-2,6-dideoxyhexose 3-C-methyltransferase
MITENKFCRICQNTNLITILDLGVQSLASRFPTTNESDPIKAPLVLEKCVGDQSVCGLVQLKYIVDSDELYTYNYGYRSGLNKTMTDHLQNLVKDIEAYNILNDNDLVMDIGSNDATLLKSYGNNNLQKVGVDPTLSQFKEYYPESINAIENYFTYEAVKEFLNEQKVKIITSICMFYDLPDPLQFMKDIAKILHKDGVWITEQSYMPTMLQRKSFDTVCHEHIEYYSIKQLQWMCERANLKIINVELNDSNGGSFRLYISHIDSKYESNANSINNLIILENNMGLDTLTPFEEFAQTCIECKEEMTLLINKICKENKTIYIYGASTKGNTLLQYYNLDSTKIIGAAERNPRKFGCRTPGTNIPIVSEDEMRNVNPDYLLVLPWHFREEFIKRESKYIESGGSLIFPLPVVEIISK